MSIRTQFRNSILTVVAALTGFLSVPRPNTSFAAETSAFTEAVVVAVEEDWVLTLNEPDANTGSPQVMTQLNPVAANNNLFSLFCLNYRNANGYIEGGMELQIWEKGYLSHAKASTGLPLSQSSESISWTQFASISNGEISLGIKNGSSTSYGRFGGNTLTSSRPTDLTNLSGYNPVDSVKNSGITLGANRVQSLRCNQVRYYYSDGTVTALSKDYAAYREGTVTLSSTSTTTELNSTSLSTSTMDSTSMTTDSTVPKTIATLGGASY